MCTGRTTSCSTPSPGLPPYGIVTAVVTVQRNGGDSERTSQRRAKKAEGRLAGGIAFTFVFGALLLFQGGWFWIFPLAFLGVGPTIEGLLALRRMRASGASELPKEPDPEHEVLRIARAMRGRITASVVAVESSLSLAEAERVLDEMARGGHATLAVNDDGRVEYEFREFFPPAAPRP